MMLHDCSIPQEFSSRKENLHNGGDNFAIILCMKMFLSVAALSVEPAFNPSERGRSPTLASGRRSLPCMVSLVRYQALYPHQL